MPTADETPGKRIRGQPESTHTRARALCRAFDIRIQVVEVSFGAEVKDVRMRSVSAHISVVSSGNHPDPADTGCHELLSD